MRNWLGQDIQTGSVVYRGAREGNSSSYKVGVVERLNEEKGTARVNWKYQPYGYHWRKDASGNNERVKAVGSMNSAGSPDIDSLVLVDIDLDLFEAKVELADEWKNSGMPTVVYEQRLAELDNGPAV